MLSRPFRSGDRSEWELAKGGEKKKAETIFASDHGGLVIKGELSDEGRGILLKRAMKSIIAMGQEVLDESLRAGKLGGKTTGSEAD